MYDDDGEHVVPGVVVSESEMMRLLVRRNFVERCGVVEGVRVGGVSVGANKTAKISEVISLAWPWP